MSRLTLTQVISQLSQHNQNTCWPMKDFLKILERVEEPKVKNTLSMITETDVDIYLPCKYCENSKVTRTGIKVLTKGGVSRHWRCPKCKGRFSTREKYLTGEKENECS
jgi:transposase-like protein